MKRRRTSRSIPDEVKEEVDGIVERFNREVLKKSGCVYVPRYKGRYVYLDRKDGRGGTPSPICRLRYTGKMDDWAFAIFKYSSERYDAGEWFFPGSEHVDGTVEGAMQAGMEAYPCRKRFRLYMIPLVLLQVIILVLLAVWRSLWARITLKKLR